MKLKLEEANLKSEEGQKVNVSVDFYKLHGCKFAVYVRAD